MQWRLRFRWLVHHFLSLHYKNYHINLDVCHVMCSATCIIKNWNFHSFLLAGCRHSYLTCCSLYRDWFIMKNNHFDGRKIFLNCAVSVEYLTACKYSFILTGTVTYLVIICHSFHVTATVLNCCCRDHMVSKAKNVTIQPFEGKKKKTNQV